VTVAAKRRFAMPRFAASSSAPEVREGHDAVDLLERNPASAIARFAACSCSASCDSPDPGFAQ
jgi:hypothetical protein